MACSDSGYKMDAIVFNLEEEQDQARQFCKELRQAVLSNGQNIRVKTFEDFCKPGKTDIDCIDDAVLSARYWFVCSKYYQEDPMGCFATKVRMTHDQALNRDRDGCIRILFERASRENHQKDLAKNPSFAALFFSSLRIPDDWKLDSYTKDKLVSLFESGLKKQEESISKTRMGEIQPRQQYQNHELESNLDIANPSDSFSTFSEETRVKDFFGLASDDLVEDANEASLTTMSSEDSGQVPEDASQAMRNTDQTTGNSGDATVSSTTGAGRPCARVEPLANNPPAEEATAGIRREPEGAAVVSSSGNLIEPRAVQGPYTLEDLDNNLC